MFRGFLYLIFFPGQLDALPAAATIELQKLIPYPAHISPVNIKNTVPAALRLQKQCLKCAIRGSNPGHPD